MNTLYELIQHQLDQRIIYKDDPKALECFDEKINALSTMLVQHHFED